LIAAIERAARHIHRQLGSAARLIGEHRLALRADAAMDLRVRPAREAQQRNQQQEQWKRAHHGSVATGRVRKA